ncbi:MAG: DUF268 domain-containing protein [Bryobacteraceae bacterium]
MPLLRVCAVYGSPELFVRSVYNVLLRRDPEPGGFAEKLRTLRRTGDRIELIRGVLSSPEYAQYPLGPNELAEDLFRGYFGRPSVAGEDDLDYWIQRASTLTRADLAAEFKAFAEAALSWQVPGGRLTRAWSRLLDLLLGRLTWKRKLDTLRDLNARILALSEKQFTGAAEWQSAMSRQQAEWQSTMSRLQEEGIQRTAQILAEALPRNRAEIVDQLLPILSLQQRHVENTQMELQADLLGQIQSLQQQVSRTALAVDLLSEKLQLTSAEVNHLENTQMELQAELLGQIQRLQEQVPRTALAVDLLSEKLQLTSDDVKHLIESSVAVQRERSRALSLIARRIAAINRLVVRDDSPQTRQLAERMQAIDRALADLKTDQAASLRELAARSPDEAISARIGEPVERVRPVTARFLNWAISGTGYFAQRRALFNHGNWSILHEGGTVETRITSRIVEVPFAHAAMADLPEGSVLIDVGSNESLLAMELAVAGFQVYSVDFRGYALQHPRLIAVQDSVLHWPGPAQPVDAIFSISTVEHIGLPAYGGTDAAPDGDLLAMKRFRAWLRPGGLLVFTAPFGAPKTTDFERTYGPEQLELLLEGFSIETRDLMRKNPDGAWTEVSFSTWPPAVADDQEMVILVKAKLTA